METSAIFIFDEQINEFSLEIQNQGDCLPPERRKITGCFDDGREFTIFDWTLSSIGLASCTVLPHSIFIGKALEDEAMLDELHLTIAGLEDWANISCISVTLNPNEGRVHIEACLQDPLEIFYDNEYSIALLSTINTPVLTFPLQKEIHMSQGMELRIRARDRRSHKELIHVGVAFRDFIGLTFSRTMIEEKLLKL